MPNLNHAAPTPRATSSQHLGVLVIIGSLVGPLGGPPAMAQCVPQWDVAFGDPGADHNVNTMAIFDDGSGPALYVGGQFTMIGGVAANRIAKWDGNQFVPLGEGVSGGSPAQVRTMTVFDDGNGEALYVAGSFLNAGGLTVNRIAKWDGQQWSALGAGIDGTVAELQVFDSGSGPELYAGGHFQTAGGTSAVSIARWNGSSWAGVGGGVSGLNPSVTAMTVYDSGNGSELIVGGFFSSAGGLGVSNIARWNGSTWLGMGVGVNNTVSSLQVYDDGSGDELFVGGAFTHSGSTVVNFIARWTGGSVWLSVPAAWSGNNVGMSGAVRSMTVYDDGGGPALYAGGSFVAAAPTVNGVNGLGVNNIARRAGGTWSALSSGASRHANPAIGNVWAIVGFDDGSGPAMYVGGIFDRVGGMPAHRIGRVRCVTWGACCVEGSIAMLTDHQCSALGGEFFMGQDPDQIDCTPGSSDCPADLNSDGVVGVPDLLEVLANWGPCPE